jgi:hypothetical protein
MALCLGAQSRVRGTYSCVYHCLYLLWLAQGRAKQQGAEAEGLSLTICGSELVKTTVLWLLILYCEPT